MKKLLYIDLPFQGEKGGDKNRSKFILEALTARYNADLLLIKNHKDTKKIKKHSGQNKLFELKTTKSKFFAPDSIFHFTKDQLAYFKKICQENQYDYIFIRFASPAKLAEIAEVVLPETKIIFDIDMVFSRLAQLSWQKRPTFKNRYFFFEQKKLEKFENKLFNKSYLFLFTNYLERNLVVEKFVKNKTSGSFKTLPNVMKKNDHPLPEKKENCILFFGSLNSAANLDAFDFICDDIYPLIQKKLKDKKIRLRIVGKNKTKRIVRKSAAFPQIELIGEVQDIDAEIGRSLFVLLPIRIASGTRTRILEAANMQTAVISTTIGAEGFEFSEKEIIIRDSSDELAQAVLQLLEDPDKIGKLGKNIQKKCEQLYLDTIVEKNLIQHIKEFGN